jgi:hypothetical protein
MRKQVLCLLMLGGFAGMLLGGPAQSEASVVQWSENGHYYDFVRAPGITWTDANAAAQSATYDELTGYLATITSAEENDFIYGAFSSQNFWESWLGGYQDPGAPRAESWHWVTGELWSYTNWNPGQPDDTGGDETYLQMWGPGTIGPGRWNDDMNDTNLANITGYFIEYAQANPVPAPGAMLLGMIGIGVATLARRARGKNRT